MIKMAIFDVDNTLFSHSARCMPDSTMEAINRLREKGIKIVIATGRWHKSILNYPPNVVTRIMPDYLIISNGQVIYDKDGKRLYHEYIKKEYVDELVEYAKEHNCPIMWKFEECAYRYVYPNTEMSYETKNFGIGFLPTMDYHNDQDILHHCLGGTISNVSLTIEEIREKFPRLNFYNQDKNAYDVNSVGIDKGYAVKKVCELEGIDPKETIAFGDYGNDVDMLKAAGIGVAMGNGSDEVKKAADYVTDEVMEDGIYNACVHFNLI